MKENKIKLAAVLVLALLFMLVFTCCVNKDITLSGDGNEGQITLFAPPETTSDNTTETFDSYVTEETIITMPPPQSGDDTTATEAEITTAVPKDTTDSEDTVYNNFSGLY